MRKYVRSRLVRIGAAIFLLGTGPLLLIIALAKLGVLNDPNPNPVGPGILAVLTAGPGLACIAIGIARVDRAGRDRAA